MGMVFEGWILSEAEARDIAAAPETVEKVLFERRPDLDLDKAWHGIHFVLTGSEEETATPVGAAVFGGRPAGPDQGYGPPRLLEPAEVRTVAAALHDVDVQKVRDDYDADQLEDRAVYPTGIWREADVLDTYLLPSLADLRRFYAQADGDEAAVLLVIR